MRKCIVACCLMLSALYCEEAEAIKRVHAHLVIQDIDSAAIECSQAVSNNPQSHDLHVLYAQLLALQGRTKEAIDFWTTRELGEMYDAYDFLEQLAWGTLSQAKESSHLAVAGATLMSICTTQDVKGVAMILDALGSSNAILRALAAQSTLYYRDAILIKRLQQLLITEKNRGVRLQIIHSLGQLEVKESEEQLSSLLCSTYSPMEEKAATMVALASMYDTVGVQELQGLITSKRSELRELACEIVGRSQVKDDAVLLIPLLQDPHPGVRVGAIKALCVLGIETLSSDHTHQILELVADSHPQVALITCWAVAALNPRLAIEVVQKRLVDATPQYRYLAAYILGRMCTYDKKAVETILQEAVDPFIRANLILGMLGHVDDMSVQSELLYTFLMDTQEEMMWDCSLQPTFRLVVPSRLHHVPLMHQYPTCVDLLTRLDIMEILAVMRYPQVEEAMKTFLTRQNLGVAYTAALTLIEEGGKESIDILRNLLQEENASVRIQAALVLALFAREPQAIAVLKQGYNIVDWEMKLHIVQALGHIGDKCLIPFLVDRLEEPHQLLKTVAAAALIQCIYH